MAASTATLGARPASCALGAAPVTPGLQLYTVRAEMQQSVERTLARVAEIGYREVEFAGYFGRTPAQVAAALKANGLAAPATHISLAMMRAEWDKVLDDSAAIGHRWVVIPSLGAAERGSVDAYVRVAGELNAAAARAKARGLSVAYHNHDYEFAPLGDTSGHAILMRECDPALVSFELDLYWVSRAARDATEYVTRHPGRFPLVHVKDMLPDGSMAEVGAGTLPFQRIFDAAKGRITHFFVEHDNPTSPYDSIRASAAAMKRFTA